MVLRVFLSKMEFTGYLEQFKIKKNKKGIRVSDAMWALSKGTYTRKLQLCLILNMTWVGQENLVKAFCTSRLACASDAVGD